MKSKWSEVLIEEYFTILKIMNDDRLTKINKELQVVAVLSGKTIKEVKALKSSEYLSMINSIGFLSTPLMSSTIPKSIYINNKLFKVTNKISDLTAGEYIDFVLLSEEWEKNIIDILTIFIKPAIFEKGFFKNKCIVVDYDREELKQFFKEYLTIDIVNNLMVFFYKVYTHLIYRTKIFLELEKIKLKRLMKKKSMTQLEKVVLKDGLIALEGYLKRL